LSPKFRHIDAFLLSSASVRTKFVHKAKVISSLNHKQWWTLADILSTRYRVVQKNGYPVLFLG